MGLDNTTAQALCGARSAGADFSSSLMIGRQWLLVAPEVVADVARFYDLAIPPRPPAQSYAEPFFAMLGAKRIDSLDFSTFEGAKKVTPENPPSKPQ